MSSAPATAAASRPGGLVAPTRRAAARRAAGQLAAGAGVAGALASVGWLVLAAAARPSTLSPPTQRAASGHGTWLLGPLHGVLGITTASAHRLHTDLLLALAAMTVAWLVAWIAAPSLPTWVIAAALLIAHLLLFLGPPQPLTDVFNYLLYGRMAAHGVNPYTHLPLQARHDPAFALSNWHHLKSPYGPLQTGLTQLLAPLDLKAELWAWKAVVVGSSLGTLALVAHLARRLGRSPQRALVGAGLCPVVLAVGVGGFHNDAPVVLCLLGAVACLVADRDHEPRRAVWPVLAGVLVVTAAGLKPSFAVAVPVVVLGCRHRLPAMVGAAWAGAAVLAVVWLDFGGALPDLKTQAALVTPLSLPNLLGVAIGHGGADAPVRSAATGLLLLGTVAAAVVVWRRPEHALPALGLLLLGAVLSLSWVVPWYLGWALPLIALGHPRRLAPVAVLATAWLVAGGLPQVPAVLHAFGYYPTRSATGEANHARLLELVR